MQPHIERNTALAQAALDHALYFLEIGAPSRAAAYYQFASQQLQSAVKTLVQAEVVSSLSELDFDPAREMDYRDKIFPGRE